MILARLFDGDLAIVDWSLTPRNGDVGVVEIDGERSFKVRKHQAPRIALHFANRLSQAWTPGRTSPPAVRSQPRGDVAAWHTPEGHGRSLSPERTVPRWLFSQALPGDLLHWGKLRTLRSIIRSAHTQSCQIGKGSDDSLRTKQRESVRFRIHTVIVFWRTAEAAPQVNRLAAWAAHGSKPLASP